MFLYLVYVLQSSVLQFKVRIFKVNSSRAIMIQFSILKGTLLMVLQYDLKIQGSTGIKSSLQHHEGIPKNDCRKVKTRTPSAFELVFP